MTGRGRGKSPSDPTDHPKEGGPSAGGFQNTRSQSNARHEVISASQFEDAMSQVHLEDDDKNDNGNVTPDEEEIRQEIIRAQQGLQEIERSRTENAQSTSNGKPLTTNDIEKILSSQLHAKMEEISSKFERMLTLKLASYQTPIARSVVDSHPSIPANQPHAGPLFNDSLYLFHLNSGRMAHLAVPSISISSPTGINPNNQLNSNMKSVPVPQNVEPNNRARNDQNNLPQNNVNHGPDPTQYPPGLRKIIPSISWVSNPTTTISTWLSISP